MRAAKVFTKILYQVSLLILSLTIASSATFAAPLIEHRVEMDDGHKLTLYSKIASNPTQSILLIHGRTWSALPDFDLTTPEEDLSMMNALVKRGMAVYAVDLRGYGKSKRDKSGWNTPNRAAKDVAAIIDFINNRHKSFGGTSAFGWSYGSMVAMLTAQQYPGKVKNLILYGFPLDTEAELKDDPQSSKPLRRPTTAKAAAEDFIVPGTISKEAIDAYVKASLAADPIRADWNRLTQWNQIDARKIAVPTLLLQAEADPYVNWDADALLFKNLATQDKQWIVLSNADHAALLELSRFKLYAAVENFLAWVDL